ncbi:MAG TPA: ATP-binding cassette domain-containing protein, partial [Armatimonadetes bacterium]|nr:ATP-binding cassette domain-containing protein [Armatimonadota bacterium]
MQSPLIDVTNLHKEYRIGKIRVPALRGITLRIQEGEFVAIMGPSGSGKSTFMNLIGCLDRPTQGTYRFDGVDVSTLDDDQLAELRSRKIG